MAKNMSRVEPKNKPTVDMVENVNEDNKVVNAPTVEKKEIEQPKQPRKFEAMDGILCRSLVDGVLVMTGIKSNNSYKWADANDVLEVEYQDLVSAVRSNTSYISAPHFIIEDEDFLVQFPQVQKIYDSMYTTADLKEILSLPVNSMMSAIKSLPDGSKENLRDIAGKMVLNGQLDSVQKIKALDEFYNTNFMITTNLYA